MDNTTSMDKSPPLVTMKSGNNHTVSAVRKSYYTPTSTKDFETTDVSVVLVNGCFDLLHTGHLYFLNKAAELGDRLFVALNGAESVRALKGPARPIQDDASRAYALAALSCVDAVFIFQTPRLTNEITALRPDHYAKAGDYTIDTINKEERVALENAGTEIHFVSYLKGFSTTELIAKIKEAGTI